MEQLPSYAQIMEVWKAVWPYITLAVTVASAVNTLPQPAPGSHWTPLRKIIAWIAISFGGALPSKAPDLGPWLLRLAAKYMSANGLAVVGPAAQPGVAPASAPMVQSPTPGTNPNIQS